MPKLHTFRFASEVRASWLMPLLFFQVYLSTIALLFFFGPWPWPIDNPVELAIFLILAQIVITLGYISSWKLVAKKVNALSADYKAQTVLMGVKFAKLCYILTLAIFIPTSLSRTGGIIPDVMGGIANSGFAYNDMIALNGSSNPFVFVEYARMILALYLAGSLPLLICYWPAFTMRWKVIGIASIGSSISVYLASGVNKGIADLICLTPFFYFLSQQIFERKGIAGRALLTLSLMAAVVGFLSFFSAGQAQREGGVGEFGVYNGGDRIVFAESQKLDWILPREGRIAYESITRYTGAGYYALALGLDIDHKSTFGIGNSMFFSRNADNLIGTDYFTSSTIPAELERRYGLGHFTTWHSIYLWYASDVGIIGSLLVIGGFSFLFGLSWGYGIVRSDHWSLIMTSYMLVMFYYISANNQVFQSGEGAVGFVVVGIAMWRYGRRDASTHRM